MSYGCDGISRDHGEVIANHSCKHCMSDKLNPDTKVVVRRVRWLCPNEEIDLPEVRMEVRKVVALTYDEWWDLTNLGGDPPHVTSQRIVGTIGADNRRTVTTCSICEMEV